MTKKHWLSVAAMLNVQLDLAKTDDERELVARICRNLAFEFCKANGAFRYDVFYESCGLLPDGNTDQFAAAEFRDAIAHRLDLR